jgi:hypothetical protein
MNITRIVYYCTYTRHSDTLPQYSAPFATEEAARVEAKKLIQQGYWGVIERHREWKQDDENDAAWHVDWEHAGDQAVEMLDSF